MYSSKFRNTGPIVTSHLSRGSALHISLSSKTQDQYKYCTCPVVLVPSISPLHLYPLTITSSMMVRGPCDQGHFMHCQGFGRSVKFCSLDLILTLITAVLNIPLLLASLAACLILASLAMFSSTFSLLVSLSNMVTRLALSV